MFTNDFEGRPYTADGSHFPAVRELASGGTVQDWRTREIREREARTEAAEAEAAAGAENPAEDEGEA